MRPITTEHAFRILRMIHTTPGPHNVCATAAFSLSNATRRDSLGTMKSSPPPLEGELMTAPFAFEGSSAQRANSSRRSIGSDAQKVVATFPLDSEMPEPVRVLHLPKSPVIGYAAKFRRPVMLAASLIALLAVV